ncbi:LamG-like jellyroll fold domain-containing protein [Desulfonema ishimotonii]|nr:LamG-like jellyroll fold domain-containing protein [Desulfonema ishimotonii]
MEEGQGTTVADSSGNGNDAALSHNSDSAGPVWESDARQGNNIFFSTEARWNNRYGNYADLGALDISSGGDRLTVGCMFRADPDQGDALLFSTRQNGNERYLNLTARSDGSFYFMIRTPDGEAACRTAAGKFQPGEWTFVVAMYDGQTMRIYADGREIFAEGGYSGGPEYAPGVHTHISALQEGNALYPFFDGNISYAFIYGRTLSATEIGFIYQNGKAAFHSGTPDETPPTVPPNLTATAVSASQTELAWEASSDDTGVAGYKIFRDDAKVGTIAGTAYGDTGLSAETAYVYKIRAYDPAGNLSDFSQPVSVTTPAATDVAPALTFIEPDGTDDTADGFYTVRWTDEDPDSSATISLYYDTDNTGADGTLIVSGLSEDADGDGDAHVWDTSGLAGGVYYVYAVIDDGVNPTVTVYSSGAVTIDQPAPVISFTADPSEITAGASSALSWNVADADTVTIDNGIGTVNTTGTQAVSPAETTTYILTATGPGGTHTASATVTVNPPAPVINTFTADPTEITAGAFSSLSWNVTNADTVTIDNGIGTVGESGSVSVSPDQTTTYTITVTDFSGNPHTAEFTINVIQPPITVNITSPADGATVTGREVTIKGTCTSPIGKSFGVTINGIAVQVCGNSFFANRVMLTEGENTITVTATDEDGNTASSSVTVMSAESDSGISITLFPESGIAPLETDLNADYSIPGTAADASVECSGPAQPTISKVSLTEYDLIFDTPGLYTVTYRITDTDGVEYTKEAMVCVQDEDETDAFFRALWIGMRDALVAGNIETACGYFLSDRREDYSQAFTALSAEQRNKIPFADRIEMVESSGGETRYFISMETEISGEVRTVGSWLIFRKDADGFWRIGFF